VTTAQAEYSRRWRARHPEGSRAASARYRAARSTAIQAKVDQNRALIDDLKAAPCMDCGGSFPPECMDFDHRPGEGNRREVGGMLRYTEVAIRAEVAKCDLVCANCHRIRTISRQRETRQ